MINSHVSRERKKNRVELNKRLIENALKRGDTVISPGTSH
jgi:hypothetical protein